MPISNTSAHQNYAQDTVIVDSTGSWLADWSDNFAKMACTHLRTPVTNSPHKQPAALLFYAKIHGREQVASKFLLSRSSGSPLVQCEVFFMHRKHSAAPLALLPSHPWL